MRRLTARRIGTITTKTNWCAIVFSAPWTGYYQSTMHCWTGKPVQQCILPVQRTGGRVPGWAYMICALIPVRSGSNVKQINCVSILLPVPLPLLLRVHMLLQMRHLKTHLRTRSGKRPFKCGLSCFDQNGQWTRHLRTHTRQKRFKCDLCGKDRHHTDCL